MSALVEVFCDFDGTITEGDTIDILLEKLAHPSWHEVEERWVRGEIGSRECMALQVPLIQGGWPAMLDVLSKVKIDPTFPRFAKWLRQRGVALKIVSDGIDRVIHHILKREGIVADNVLANHLVENEDGSLALTFPHAPQYQGCSSGLCKCRILENAPSQRLKVVIGDGRSDFCWSAEADMVFAKSKLLQHCRSNRIECIAYEDFTTVRSVLDHKLNELALPETQLVPNFAQAV